LIAHSARAADLHSQVQTALAFLSYLPAEPCPDYLADLTIRRLRRLSAQRASAEGPRPRVIGIDPRGRFGNTAAVTAVAASIVVFAGILILSSSSTPPYRPRHVPAGQAEKVPVNMERGDSHYAWLPILDELQVTGPMPQVPGLFSGGSGSAGDHLRRMDHFPELGPRVVPASWEHHPEQPPQNHLLRSLPPVSPGQSR